MFQTDSILVRQPQPKTELTLERYRMQNQTHLDPQGYKFLHQEDRRYQDGKLTYLRPFPIDTFTIFLSFEDYHASCFVIAQESFNIVFHVV